jgi:hypothetical protein
MWAAFLCLSIDTNYRHSREHWGSIEVGDILISWITVRFSRIFHSWSDLHTVAVQEFRFTDILFVILLEYDCLVSAPCLVAVFRVLYTICRALRGRTVWLELAAENWREIVKPSLITWVGKACAIIKQHIQTYPHISTGPDPFQFA